MHKFFKAVAFVSIFSVLTRAIGFFLRIYLSRMLGAEALGSYQISMSIFGVLMTIVSSGLPLVISRNVAYYNSRKDKNLQHKTISAGLIIAVGISVVVSVFIWACPQFLELFIKSQESIKIIQMLLPALIASAVYSILRGGLWGKKCFFTISFTEFFEQVVRIILVVILFSTPVVAMSASVKAALSLTLSCIISAVLVAVLYFVFGGRLKNPKSAFKPVVKTSLPITLVRTVSSVVGSIIAVIIPLRLTKFGLSTSEALAQFGMFMGMTMPILMIPSTFTGSIAVALVPEMSGHTNNIDSGNVKNMAALARQVTLAIKSTIIISFVLMPCFICLGEPICEFLFKSAEAGRYLSVSAMLMLPMGLGQICGSMLNAIGLEMKALINYAIGAILLFLSIYFLPKYVGVYAIFIGLMCMHSVTSLLSLKMLNKRKLIDWSVLQTVLIMALICMPTTLLGYLTYSLFFKFAGLIISLCVAGLLTFTFTILLIFVFDLANIKVLLSKFKITKKASKKTFVNN